MAVIRTTIYLEDKDRRALSVIQRRYGLATLSDAIRFSIRVVQGLAPAERAIFQQLPSRGQRRTKKLVERETFIVQAQQISQATKQIISKTKEFLHKRRRRA